MSAKNEGIDPCDLGSNDTLKTIFISRTLTAEALSGGDVFSSSEKFERSFIEAYSKLTSMSVISISKKGSDEKFFEGDSLCFKYSNYLKLLEYILKIPDPKRYSIISTGYNPFIIILSLLLKAKGGNCYSFIYDSHTSNLEYKSFLKKFIIISYFNIGFFLAKKFSGWIVVNDKFINDLKVNIDFLKIKIPIDPDLVKKQSKNNNKKGKIFLFSGTINRENGIHVLLSAFNKVKDNSAQLHIFGSGPMEKDVRRASEINNRISFFGRVENATVMVRQREADFLIHLRDPSCVSASFAYPSKLIEYISSGSTVISNMFPGMDDAAEHVILIPAFEATCLSEKMEYLLSTETVRHVANPDLDGFLSRRQWPVIAAEVRDFVARNRRGCGG